VSVVFANPTEKQFQLAVIELAKLCGWLVHAERPARTATGWRTPIQGDAGFPDVVFVKPGTNDDTGRIIFAELKTVTGKASVAQRIWLKALDDCIDVHAYIWTPNDWDEIAKELTS